MNKDALIDSFAKVNVDHLYCHSLRKLELMILRNPALIIKAKLVDLLPIQVKHGKSKQRSNINKDFRLKYSSKLGD